MIEKQSIYKSFMKSFNWISPSKDLLNLENNNNNKKISQLNLAD